MADINQMRDELSRVAADICRCSDPDERERLIKTVDEIVVRIPSDDAMLFYQWRHYGTA